MQYCTTSLCWLTDQCRRVLLIGPVAVENITVIHTTKLYHNTTQHIDKMEEHAEPEHGTDKEKTVTSV